MPMNWVEDLRDRADGKRDERAELGALIGPTRSVGPNGAECFALDIFDLDTDDAVPAHVPLDFCGHGLAIHPRRPNEVVLFEKRGARGCALDLATRRAVRPIAPMADHAFYGHGAYSREGDVLFVVETQLESRVGTLSIRDASTFAILGAVPTYGIAPHDCHLVEDGRTLVVTNGGGPVGSPLLPSVTFVDAASGALLEKHEVIDERRNAGHVATTETREFALVSAAREGLPVATSLGGVSLRKQGESWSRLEAPDAVTSRLVGESLSVAIHGPSRTVLATHPESDMITFWSLDRGELTAKFELPGPRGVTMTLDQRFFAISYGPEARLLLIQACPLLVLADGRRPAGIFGGAHLYTWKS